MSYEFVWHIFFDMSKIKLDDEVHVVIKNSKVELKNFDW